MTSRFKIGVSYVPQADPRGPFVLYPDHIAAVERLQTRCAEHEQFRHQHRDCDAMGVENQRLRDLLSRWLSVAEHIDLTAEQYAELVHESQDVLGGTASRFESIFNDLADDGLSGDEELEAAIDADNERMMIRSPSRVDCGCYTSVGEEVTIHYCPEHAGKMFESGLPTVRIPDGLVLAYQTCPLWWRVQPKDMPAGWSYPVTEKENRMPAQTCIHCKAETRAVHGLICIGCGQFQLMHAVDPSQWACDAILKRGTTS